MVCHTTTKFEFIYFKRKISIVYSNNFFSDNCITDILKCLIEFWELKQVFQTRNVWENISSVTLEGMKYWNFVFKITSIFHKISYKHSVLHLFMLAHKHTFKYYFNLRINNRFLQ